MEAETRKLEEQRHRAQAEATKLDELNKLATAEIQVQKQLAQAELEEQRRQAQAEQEKLEEQKRHLEQQTQQAAAAGVADLALDPKNLDMDVTLPPLGSGTSADTFRGTYRFTSKAEPTDVAVKLFRGGHAASQAVRDQILQEIRIGARLQHENLVQMFGTIEVPGHGMVLVMELARGGSLRDVLSNRQGHPVIAWPVRVRWLTGIAQGMAKLHSLLPRAIIHRDLKSANVLLSNVDLQLATAKICDFGLAKAAETVRTNASGGGGIAGSLSWKAPETYRERYTSKSDVYGFAVVGFEVVTRFMPFEGISDTGIIGKLSRLFDPQEENVLLLVKHGIATLEGLREAWLKTNPLADRRPDLSLAEAGCPEALCALIRRCWADEPDERPEFSECLAELQAFELRTFASSHFKREYEKRGRIQYASQVFSSVADFVHMYCQVHGLVSAQHAALQSQFVQLLSRMTGARPEVDALGKSGVTAELLWTSDLKFEGAGDEHNKELCSLLNAAIRSDEEELMPSAAGLARSINTLCVVRYAGADRAFPEGGITFRGTGFDDRYRDFFEPKKKYRVPGFLATSFSEATARRFVFTNGTALDRPAVLWVVHVDPRGRDDADYRCKHVNFIEHALVPGEQEYLFTAYSVFTVRSCMWAEGDKVSRIEVDAALDNVAEPEDLPLAPWY